MPTNPTEQLLLRMNDREGDDIIVYKHYDNAFDANIAKTKLDAYGIPCFLTEENMANLIPGQSLFAIKSRLHLFAADQDRAAQVLTSDQLSIAEEAGICPRCRSHRITRGFPKEIADSAAIVFFGVFMPHKKVDQCLDCGLEF